MGNETDRPERPAKRTFDMRAPRATRSTKDSSFFQDSGPPKRDSAPAPSAPAETGAVGHADAPKTSGAIPPVKRRRPQSLSGAGTETEPAKTEASVEERAAAPVRPATPRGPAATSTGSPRRGEHHRGDRPRGGWEGRRRDEPRRDESGRDEPRRREPQLPREPRPATQAAAEAQPAAPRRVDRPAPKPPTPVAPPAPEPPTLEDELRVLGAKPVTQLRAREEKPRTALEAMRARSQQTPKGKKQGGPTHRPNPDKEVSNTEPASAKDDSQSTADAESDAPTRKTAAEASPGKKTKKPVKARPQVRPEPEPEPEEPPKPKSFWARVRSLITGR